MLRGTLHGFRIWPTMDLHDCLKRINFHQSIDVLDLGLLKDLCMSFVSTVPYETLDIFGGPRHTLDLPVIYENIVHRKRGGFCVELNGLFHWILEKIGYKTTMYMAYGISSDGSLDGGSHMILRVDLDDKPVLVDVGWGGTSFVYPLKFDVDIEQSQPNGTYRISCDSNIHMIQKKKQRSISLNETIHGIDMRVKDAWSTFYAFKTEPKTFEDFQHACEYAQDSHPFCTQNCLAILQNEYRRIFLIGQVLIEKTYVDFDTVKVTREELLGDDELKKILEEVFNIKLDFRPNIIYEKDMADNL